MDPKQQVLDFKKKVDLICEGLLDGLFYREVATKAGVDLAFVKTVAERVNWDESWLNSTDVERTALSLIKQGRTLVEVRDELQVDLSIIIGVARRSGLDKKAREKLRETAVAGSYVKDEKPKTVDDQVSSAENRYAKAREMWANDSSLSDIAREYRTTVWIMKSRITKMRDMFGWFPTRPRDLADAAKDRKRKKRHQHYRRVWKYAEKLWIAGNSVEEIAAAVGRSALAVRLAIGYCQKNLGMFRPLDDGRRRRQTSKPKTS